ncbi:MAG: hypothetical protein HYV02_04080 [Deltaproteobacteria bacterium]|nr:hypothetical protein [Deltaproteobacteria bacterium]
MAQSLDVGHQIEENCLNCGHFTGGAAECPHCGAILFNEDDAESMQEENGDLSEFDDEL